MCLRRDFSLINAGNSLAAHHIFMAVQNGKYRISWFSGILRITQRVRQKAIVEESTVYYTDLCISRYPL